MAPKQTKTVNVPVGADGKWSIKVTGPSFNKTFSGGCDCAKAPTKPLANAALMSQDAVPSVEYQFPWLVVGAASALSAAGGAFLARMRGRKTQPATQD